MTCVLPVAPFYTIPFSADALELQMRCGNFDYDCLNSQCIHSGLPNDQKCSPTPGTIRHGQFNVRYAEGPDTDLNADEKDKTMSLNGKQAVHGNSTKHGVKRKVEDSKFEELYIPPKRVSPFLNTPKERKDERRKILKISIKKLKQTDDPESFLRRTVLVNNTMKQLQMELRTENLKTYDRNYFNGYGALQNSCLSDSYLVDDPFLSGVHDKITDDMTDTLINNVFHDTPNDRTKESDNEAKNT